MIWLFVFEQPFLFAEVVMAHFYSEKCVFSSVGDIRNRHVTVMGLGLNGGGEAAVRFFLSHGAFVTVTDMKTEEQLLPTIKSIEADRSLDRSRLAYHLGGHELRDFETADCVIKNPGVKYDGNRFLAASKAVETDISIFLRFSDAPVIAVTGSKGKSSTVSAAHFGLVQAGFSCYLGGNITVSPLTFFDKVNSGTPVVLELSSWQLADLRGRNVLRPKISLITKIVPDHQNWYGGMEPYVADKRLIYADQDSDSYSIFDSDGDEPGTGPSCGGTWGDFFASESRARVLRYGKAGLKHGEFGVWQATGGDGGFRGKALLPGMEAPEVILDRLAVPGEHMRTNVLNAALIMYLMGVSAERTAGICAEWKGIPHRLQFFYSTVIAGREYRFFNDSAATVPESAAAAVASFGRPVFLVTGGTDKGLDLSPLTDALSGGTDAVLGIYLLEGTATDKIVPVLLERGIHFEGPFASLDELMAAMKYDFSAEKNFADKEKSGRSGSLQPEIVVFSPGATSFGMFTNEFDRGEKFMDAVKRTFC